MTSLSTEQLKKIEENKKAALLKRQQICKSATAPPPSNVYNRNSTHNGSSMHASPENKFGSQSHKNDSTIFTFPSVVASLRIAAEDRFVVDMNYHASSIELFKNTPGKMYDASLKKWSFPISIYETFIQKLKSLKEVSINGIPKSVVNAFKTSTESCQTNDIDLSKIEKTLVNALMPFQTEGVRFGISRNGRCLIADDMGLGKTIQALGIAHYFRENWPLLIVCPSSMRFPWEEAVQTFLPSVNPFYITVMTTSKDLINEAQVVICSYDLMKSCLDALRFKKFGVIILDESHFLKSQKSARTRASLQLAQKCSQVILLTGTPALSRPQELYPQIYAIDPTLFRTLHDFGLRYCDAKRNKFGWDYSGSSNMEELELLLKKKIMVRRLKSEVVTQLPSKLRKVVILRPSMVKAISKQLNEYAVQLENQRGAEKRGTLLTYYCATGKAKLGAVCEYIAEKLEGQNKFLVFAHHTEVLNGISEMLSTKNIDFIRIDGSTHPESRKVFCDKFQTQEKCKVAVLSIKAANSGITLTAAQLVVFAELYWNPGELTQAEDRAHRIGQHDSVVVEYLVAKGTADEHLWSLVQSKLSVLNQAGLSKDNFKDTDTEHLANRDQLTLTTMFQTFQENPVTDSEEAACFSVETTDDDNVLANLNLEALETEYETENKKRKTIK